MQEYKEGKKEERETVTGEYLPKRTWGGVVKLHHRRCNILIEDVKGGHLPWSDEA